MSHEGVRFASKLALLACFATGCGGDDGPGSSGSGAGGTSGVPGDTKAPEFTGLAQATVVSEDRVELSWEPATDDVTTPGRIAYAIYSASAEGKQDFDKPYAFTPAGADGAVLSGLEPTHDYFWVVRAIDEAGNQDSNTVEHQATPPDETPPRFAGAIKVTAATSRSLFVEWKPARDNATAEADMRYRVYVSSEPEVDTFKFDDPDAETAPGETTAVVGGFDPLTDYYVIVRAVDASGLEETNTIRRTAKTPEGEPPTFAGIKQAIATPQGVKLYWLPASDNTTETANMVYTVHISDQEIFSGDALATPAFVTQPAALSFVVPGLTAGMRYWFIVRARDTGGNSDANTNFVSVRPISGTDSVAPDFEGVVAVTSQSPSTLVASWAAAIDDVTPANRLVYDLFVQDAPGGPAAGAKPTLTSAPGATSATITGLPPQATRYVVVRARDEAGNSLANNVEASGATLARPAGGDLIAPEWGGGPPTAVIPASGVMKRPTKLDVSWPAATDDVGLAGDIRYHVCAEPVESDCLGTEFVKHISATSEWGATSTVVQNRLPRTRYFVYVRAEDRSGNFETGAHGTSRTTATSFIENVFPILSDRCNGCHNFTLPKIVDIPGGYVDPRLPNPGGATGGGVKLIDPGFPENSLIYRRINPQGLTTPPFDTLSNQYVGIQEPRDGIGARTEPLSGAEDGAIRDWILQGAWGD